MPKIKQKIENYSKEDIVRIYSNLKVKITNNLSFEFSFEDDFNDEELKRTKQKLLDTLNIENVKDKKTNYD